MACSMHRRKEKKQAQKVLARNHKEKKLLGSPRYRLDLKIHKMEGCGIDGSGPGYEQVVGVVSTVIILQVV